MKITLIGFLAWVTLVFGWTIWTDKWRGVLQCAVIVIASALVVLGERFQFNGNLVALVFVAIVIAAYFTAARIRRCVNK